MKKIKVSHTVSKDYVKWIDSEIKKKRFGSRSHAIDYALKQLIDNEKLGGNPIERRSKKK